MSYFAGGLLLVWLFFFFAMLKDVDGKMPKGASAHAVLFATGYAATIGAFLVALITAGVMLLFGLWKPF
jgi:hypothetical protein